MFMIDQRQISKQQSLALTELAERGLEQARELERRMLATKDLAVRIKLSEDFVRVADAVRRAIALSARIERELRRRDRDSRAVDARTVQAAERAMREAVAAAGAPWPDDPSRH